MKPLPNAATEPDGLPQPRNLQASVDAGYKAWVERNGGESTLLPQTSPLAHNHWVTRDEAKRQRCIVAAADRAKHFPKP